MKHFSYCAVGIERRLKHVNAPIILLALAATLFGGTVTTRAAITWDAQSGTQWWFDPVNWNVNSNVNNLLPPNNGFGAPTDTLINIGTAGLPGGEGVVYDPAQDPFFASANGLTYPVGYGPQSIQALYVSRATNGSNPIGAPVPNNLLTIKGDLNLSASVTIGRSSGIDGTTTNGTVVQINGLVSVPLTTVDLGGSDVSQAGNANGTWDYRGGSLEIGVGPAGGGNGLRLSGGSTTLDSVTGRPFGAAGVGKFIEHNPAAPGHVHVISMSFASFAGVPDGATDGSDPNGITTGVAIAEFHYENGNTRPIQMSGNLAINNGLDANTMGTRSSRLGLRLDAAPTVTGGVPQNLGLFDVDSDPNDFLSGAITGTGSLGRYFSDATGAYLYSEGAIVSAVYGSTAYEWNISYTGRITWTDANNGVVASIAGPGSANDVVLIGKDIYAIPEPATSALLMIGVVVGLNLLRLRAK